MIISVNDESRIESVSKETGYAEMSNEIEFTDVHASISHKMVQHEMVQL